MTAPPGPAGDFTAGLPAPRTLALRSLPCRLTLFDLRCAGPGPARQGESNPDRF